MLVLSRHRDELINIGDDITVAVLDIRGDKVRLGIDAPQSVAVHRSEVYDAIKRSHIEPNHGAELPVEFAPHRTDAPSTATDGVLFVDEAKLNRLRQISRLVNEYHRQMNVMASECCAILGQPDDHSDEADLCRQIVDHSANVEDTVSRLMTRLAVKRANKMLGEAG